MRVTEIKKYEILLDGKETFALAREIRDLTLRGVDMFDLRTTVLEPLIRSYLDGSDYPIVIDEDTSISLSNWMTRVLDEHDESRDLLITRAIWHGLRGV